MDGDELLRGLPLASAALDSVRELALAAFVDKLTGLNGHVNAEEFRAEIDRWFGGSKRKPSIPPGATITHVYIRSARVENDDYGNRQYEWRHSASGRPMTYFEVAPNRNSGG